MRKEGYGARLRRVREERGFTQKDVADAVGISKSAIQQWEQEKSRPIGSNLVNAAAFLGVAPDYIITGRESAAVRPFDGKMLAEVIEIALSTEDYNAEKRSPQITAQLILHTYLKLQTTEQKSREIMKSIFTHAAEYADLDAALNSESE